MRWQKGWLLLAVLASLGMAFFIETQRCILSPVYVSDREAMEAALSLIKEEYRVPFESLEKITKERAGCCDAGRASGILGLFSERYWRVRLKLPHDGEAKYMYGVDITRCGCVIFLSRVS
jgi:hypothetical protein